MKNFLAFALVSLMVLAAFAACDQGEENTPDTTTDAITTQAPETEKETEKETEPETTAAPETTVAEESTLNELGLPFEIIDVPVGYANGIELRGYNASGAFYYDEELNCLYSDSDNNMLVVTNDQMEAGTLTATFLSAPGYVNDNGIIFGLEEIPTNPEEYYFWEFGPAYYFLFICDAERLYLAKAGYNDTAWTELYVTDEPVTDYTHGETNITITVEFDGEGTIKCYANGELLIDYYDEDPIRGSYYGVRCEVFGVEYYNIQAEHD